MNLVWLGVGDSSRLQVSKTNSTQLIIHPASHEGDPVNNGNPTIRDVIRGWNEDGQEHTDDSANARVYDLANGGIVDSVPTSGTPAP